MKIKQAMRRIIRMNIFHGKEVLDVYKLGDVKSARLGVMNIFQTCNWYDLTKRAKISKQRGSHFVRL